MHTQTRTQLQYASLYICTLLAKDVKDIPETDLLHSSKGADWTARRQAEAQWTLAARTSGLSLWTLVYKKKLAFYPDIVMQRRYMQNILQRHAGVGDLFSDWRGVASHAQVGAWCVWQFTCRWFIRSFFWKLRLHCWSLGVFNSCDQAADNAPRHQTREHISVHPPWAPTHVRVNMDERWWKMMKNDES